jgi:hypothetical protein
MVDRSNSESRPSNVSPADEFEQQDTTSSEVSDRNTGRATTGRKPDMPLAAGGVPSNDPDINQYQAQVVGEEAVGGTTPTPDQDIADEIAAAVGVEFRDRQPLQVEGELERRDDRRWELDPKSAEDYEDRGR